MAITDAWLKASHGKTADAVSTRSDRDGLSVRVSAKGKLTFQIRYRFNAKQRRMDLGSYPQMSLKKARAKNLRMRAYLEEGYDPAQMKLQELALINEEPTVEQLFSQWYDSECVHDTVKHAQILRTFELHVFPGYGKIKAGKVGTNQWVKLIDDIKKEAPSIASRVLTQSKKMYRWAIRREIAGITSNPVSDLSAKNDFKIQKNRRKRVLNDDEIALVWEALRGMRLSPRNKMMIKLALFYGCRIGELRLAKKKDFNFDENTWTVPVHKTFNNDRLNIDSPIIRPIIEEIKPTLERLIALSEHKELVFTMVNRNEPMKEGAQLDFPYQIIQWAKSKKKIKMPRWSCHDLRRTMRTNMSAITTPHIAEIMVGHALSDNHETYDHYHYLPEQTEAYAAWFAKLESIVDEF